MLFPFLTDITRLRPLGFVIIGLKGRLLEFSLDKVYLATEIQREFQRLKSLQIIFLVRWFPAITFKYEALIKCTSNPHFKRSNYKVQVSHICGRKRIT